MKVSLRDEPLGSRVAPRVHTFLSDKKAKKTSYYYGVGLYARAT